MTKPVDFIILRADAYEQDGAEKFRFAAAATGENAPDVVFIFDEYDFVETEEGIQARCYIHFGEADDNQIVPIKEEDPRYEMLSKMGQQILMQVTEPCFNELAQMAEKAESLLDVSDATPN